MDDKENEARYTSNQFPANYRQRYSSSHRSKLAARNSYYSEQIGNEFSDEDDEEVIKEEEEEEGEKEEEEEEEEEDEHEEEKEENGFPRIKEETDGEDDEEDHRQDDDEDNDDDNEDDGDDIEDGEDSEIPRKKRKLKNLSSSYEFAPRIAPTVVAMPAPKSSFGRRSSPADWTETATFALLDAWGDRFIQLGRKSLRSDEWIEVAEKVSEASKTVRTDTQCRNRLDTLKKIYKKEKMKSGAMMINGTYKWVYFKKMDMLMNASPKQIGSSCALDSGRFVSTNPRVYLNNSNGLDGVRDHPGNFEFSDDDNSDGLPPKRTNFKRNGVERSSFKLLADSIQKFGDVYEKIENTRKKQMLELEKMRMEFRKDLEMQKRKILERARAEIMKMQQEDDEEIEVSIENPSK